MHASLPPFVVPEPIFEPRSATPAEITAFEALRLAQDDLAAACAANDVEAAIDAMNRGASPNAQPWRERAPLAPQRRDGAGKLLPNELLEGGQKFWQADGSSPFETLLHCIWTPATGNAPPQLGRALPMAQALRARGWDCVFRADMPARTPFMHALLVGDSETAFWLLDELKLPPDDAAGGSALCWAFLCDDQAVRRLASLGANPSARHRWDESVLFSPLLLARVYGHFPRAQLLMELGAPIEDLRKPDPLDEAANRAIEDAVRNMDFFQFEIGQRWAQTPDSHFEGLLNAKSEQQALSADIGGAANGSDHAKAGDAPRQRTRL